MRLILVRLVTPPTPLVGYLRRYLVQLETGVLLGSGSRALMDDIQASLEDTMPTGYMLVSDYKTETGFRFVYWNQKGANLVDLDGIVLPEKLIGPAT